MKHFVLYMIVLLIFSLQDDNFSIINILIINDYQYYTIHNTHVNTQN